MAEVAEVGRLDAHRELLPRLQSQLPQLKHRVDEIEIRGVIRGAVRELANGAAARFLLVDRVLEPHPAQAVVVGDPAHGGDPRLRRDGRADAVELHGHLRRLVQQRHQHQPHRVAALDAVGVGQGEQERRILHQRRQGVGEAAAIGRQAALPRSTSSAGAGAIVDDAC